MLKKAKSKIVLDLDVDPEFYDYIFENVHTELEMYEDHNKLVLYTEHEIDLPHIQSDIEQILRLVEKINLVYKMVGYPWEAIEILNGRRRAVNE